MQVATKAVAYSTNTGSASTATGASAKDTESSSVAESPEEETALSSNSYNLTSIWQVIYLT